MGKKSRRTNPNPTRKKRIAYLRWKIQNRPNFVFRHHVCVHCEEDDVDAELWRLEEVDWKKARADARADAWMEEHPYAADRCARRHMERRPEAKKKKFSWFRKIRHIRCKRGLPTEAEFQRLWEKRRRDMGVTIQLGELMRRIDAKFPRRIIFVNGKPCGSEGGVYKWFMENIPSMKKHYVTLMYYKRIVDKLHILAKRKKTTIEKILAQPQACSLKTLSEYLNAELAICREPEREQPFKYKPRELSDQPPVHHTYPGRRYDNPAAVAKLAQQNIPGARR